jgi:hypothetical protein
VNDSTSHKPGNFEPEPLYERMIAAANATRGDSLTSELHIVELLRDFGEHARAHPLARVMDRAEIIIEAADLLEELYTRLVLATGVIEQSGIIWMGEQNTKALLERAKKAHAA